MIRQQAGFTLLEGVLVIAALALIGFMGVTAYKTHQAATNMSVTAPKAETPTAPDITSAADLTTAQSTLDSSDLDATETDSDTLNTELSGL